MPTSIRMYYGHADDETQFDATRWFASGQYLPRQTRGYPPSQTTMLRSRPMAFSQEQLNELPFIASTALQEDYADLDSLSLIRPPRDLSQRVRYAYSTFADRDQPVDYYYLYVDVEGLPYLVTFDRDGQTGALRKKLYRAEALVEGSASQTEHLEVWAQLKAQERRAGR